MNYSKQCDIILSYVKSVKTHPTAEEVYTHVRKKNNNISLGTVYRNLEKLAEEKIILRIKMANKKDRFDGNISHHYHGICNNCGKIVDIFTDYYYNIDDDVKNKTALYVLSHDIIFNVICKECKN